jgi:hypothetical protein
MRTVRSYTTSVVLASAARTTTGQSTQFWIGNGDKLAVMIDATVVTGTTPSMTVNVEWSHNGVDWFVADPADAFTAITAAGKKVKLFDIKGTSARLNYTISGTTPSFTFAALAVVGS